jgi:hypothetical protein
MSGDGLVKPQNAPPGLTPYPGVQPGTNNNILRARLVIVSGVGDGVFVYAAGTTPALGNPPIAWMGSGLVDPYGNVLPSTTGVAASGTFQAGNTIISPSGIFTYNGTPGPNNLLLSNVDAATVDGFGNQVPAGLTVYSATNPGFAQTMGFGGDFSNYTNADGAASQQGAWLLGALFFQDALIFYSTQPFVTLGQAPPAPTALTAAFYGNTVGTPAGLTPAGFAGTMALTQTVVQTFTNANNGTAAACPTLTIPAHDAAVGTVYVIEFPFNGVFETSTLGFKPNLNGTVETTTGGDTIGAGFFSAAGTAFAGNIRLRMAVTSATSVDLFLDGSIGNSSTRASGTNGTATPLNSQVTGVAFNPAVSNTLLVSSVWGAGVVGQSVTSNVTEFTRRGP